MKKLSVLSLLLATSAVVTGCFSGNEKEILLTGERIDIISKSVVDIKMEPAALNTQFVLTRASDNAEWLQTGGRAGHNMHHVSLPKTVHKAWSRNIGAGRHSSGGLLFQPVVKGGILYAADAKSRISAVRMSDGKKIWSLNVESAEKESLKYSVGLAISGNNLIATTSAGEVIAYDLQTQKESWRTNVAVPVRSAATVGLGKVFVIGHNNSLFALDAETGRLTWTHSSIEERLALFGGGSAALDLEQEVVLVPYSSGEIYAIDAKTGRYLWSDSLSVSQSGELYSSLIDIEAAPVISERIAYAVNHNGTLSAYYMPNGRRLWSKEMSATQMPWVAGNVMYVTTDTGEIVCLNRVDGKVRWVKKLADIVQTENDEKLEWSSPILAGKRLFVTSSAGAVVALHPVSGELKGQLNLKSGVTTPPLVVDNTLVFYTDDARIVTFK